MKRDKVSKSQLIACILAIINFILKNQYIGFFCSIYFILSLILMLKQNKYNIQFVLTDFTHSTSLLAECATVFNLLLAIIVFYLLLSATLQDKSVFLFFSQCEFNLQRYQTCKLIKLSVVLSFNSPQCPVFRFLQLGQRYGELHVIFIYNIGAKSITVFVYNKHYAVW